MKTILGYDRYDPSGKNSGDSRNGNCQRTVQTPLGPITVDVLRDRNGEYKSMALHYNEDIGKRKVKCWRSLV